MRLKNSAFLPEDSLYPFGGVNYLDPSTLMDSRVSPEMMNVDTVKGHLSKRNGYLAMSTVARQAVTSITRSSNTATVTTTLAHGYTNGDSITISGATQTDYNGTFVITVTGATTFTYTVANTPATPATGTIKAATVITGVALAVVEFTNIAGTRNQVLITTTKEYKWNGSSWDDITFRTAGPVYTVKTGSEDDGIDWIVVTGYDSAGVLKTWLLFTNGVDKPRYWDGSLSHFYEFSTATVVNKGAALSYPNFVTTKAFGLLNNYLIMANVTTTGTEPRTVVWSDGANLTDFTTQGNAGAIPLVDATGALLKLLPLGDRMQIYAEDTVHQMIHTGDDNVFAFERVLTNTRLLSQRAVVDLETFHLFMGQENIYLYDGTRLLRKFAESITLRYRDTLQSDLKTRAWGFLDKPKNHVYFCLPTGNSNSVIYKAEYDVYDIQNIRWMPQEYISRVTCMGFMTRETTLTWDTTAIATLTWDQAGFLWNQGSINKGFPQRVMGHSAAVSLADDTLRRDGSVAIRSIWQSIDFTLPKIYESEFGRWTEIEFEARGDSVQVFYSTDGGGNFTYLTTLTLNGNWIRYRIDLDVIARTFRFKLLNDTIDSGFENRFGRVWVSPSGAW